MLFLLLYLFQMKQIPKLFLFQQQQLIHNSVKKLLIFKVSFTSFVKTSTVVSTIFLAELFHVLKEHLHIIIISTLICAILVGAFTIFFVSKKYESTARIFPKPEVNEGIVDYSQINSNNSMTKNYIALLGGNNIQSKVAKE